MQTGRARFSVLAGVLLALMTGQAQAQAEDFHPARTPAEQALDRMLAVAGQEPDSGLYAVGHPQRNRSRDRVFAGLFSDRLRKAWTAAEQAALKANCGGKYKEGEACGLDFSPILCAQDSAETYLYLTRRETAEDVVVDYLWPGEKIPAARYRLIQKAGQWQMDGVHCAGGERFNFKE